jgi:hypothetical protein
VALPTRLAEDQGVSEDLGYPPADGFGMDHGRFLHIVGHLDNRGHDLNSKQPG